MTPEQSEQAITEFKIIYKDVFGIELRDEEATEKAMAFLQLFDCLTQEKKV